MSLFDTVRRVFSRAEIKLPTNLGSAGDVKTRAREVANQHGDKLDAAAGRLKQALPGDRADKAVDLARDKIDNLTKQ